MPRPARLTPDDIARLAKAVGALHEPRRPADVLAAALDAVGELLSAPVRTGALVQPPRAGRKGAPLIRQLVIRNLPAAAARAYEQLVVDADPLVTAVRAPVGQCRVVRFDRVARTGALYRDVLKPAGVTDSIGVLSPGRAELAVVLWLHRTRHRFGTRDSALLDYLLPHLRRALSAAEERPAARLEPPGEAVPAVFLYDRRGGLISTNAAGRRLLGAKSTAAEEDSSDWGRLGSAAVGEELASLARRLWEMHAEGRSPEPPRPLILGSVAFDADAGFGGGKTAGRPETLLLVLRRAGVTPEPARPIPRAAAESPAQALAEVLLPRGITRAELAVARLLWEARLEKQIAREIHRSRETVKSHVRSIYRKCGVSRRAEWSAWVADQLLRRSGRLAPLEPPIDPTG